MALTLALVCSLWIAISISVLFVLTSSRSATPVEVAKAAYAAVPIAAIGWVYLALVTFDGALEASGHVPSILSPGLATGGAVYLAAFLAVLAARLSRRGARA